jgi:hypothetical protein
VSAGIFLDFLVEELQCNVFLLGVQPERTTLGTGISKTVNRTLEILEGEIVKALSRGETISSDIFTPEPTATFWQQ